jgi:outer membrane protein, multidrug efflux system
MLAAATSAQEAAQLVRLRFDSGVTDFLIVLDAEREVLSNRDQLAQAQTDTATALVSVYRALGRGWAAPVAQRPRCRAVRAASRCAARSVLRPAG